jgi:hypothetical protein
MANPADVYPITYHPTTAIVKIQPAAPASTIKIHLPPPLSNQKIQTQYTHLSKNQHSYYYSLKQLLQIPTNNPQKLL